MNIINLFETQIDDAKSSWEVKIINENSEKNDSNNNETSDKDIAKETKNGT